MEWYQEFIVDGKSTNPRAFMKQEYLDELMPLIPRGLTGKVVLDLGCNAGLVSCALANLGARVVGFDYSERYLDQAHLMKPNAKNPQFILMDIDKLEPSMYDPDLIVALSVLYHLKNPRSMIEKCCKTGAQIVASFRNAMAQQYVEIFRSFDREPLAFATYAKKTAVLF